MFFFSSRRRHTRLQGDWSSDVCSSDLIRWVVALASILYKAKIALTTFLMKVVLRGLLGRFMGRALFERSEERRVGKECRGGGSGGAEARKTGKWGKRRPTRDRRTAPAH